ncbi:MAG: DsbC family protein [Deltaproteobacteria bacterium]|nr:DsbC family protein [Deltaproteobacteria bacterium]
MRSLFAILMLLLPATLCAAPASSQMMDAFTKDFPTLPADEIHETAISGIYEVVSEDQIFYYAPESHQLLTGNLMTMTDKTTWKNLTDERIQQIMEERIKNISLKEALVIGNGPHTVIEITDPDCSYCRKGSNFFRDRTDVTRYIFFKPLKMHPRAMTKAIWILSSKNPAEAYEAAFSGEYDDEQKPLPEHQDNGRFLRQMQAIAPLKVSATPAYWVDGHYISGSNIKAILWLLKTPLPADEQKADPKTAADQPKQ